MREEDIVEIFNDQSSWKGELSELKVLRTPREQHRFNRQFFCFPQIVYADQQEISFSVVNCSLYSGSTNA